MGGRSRPTEADLNRWRHEVKLARKIARVALDALVFYANPETYFGIGWRHDPPAGDWMKDFNDTEDGYKPGKRARRAIEKLRAFMPAQSESDSDGGKDG